MGGRGNNLGGSQELAVAAVNESGLLVALRSGASWKVGSKRSA